MNMLISQPGALLQRVADSLEQDVVPALPASYQRTEVEATVLLLRNLAGRISWRGDDLAVDLAAADALAAVLGGGAAPDVQKSTDFDSVLDARARLGALIDDAYVTADGAERDERLEAVVAELRSAVDREQGRNLAGSGLVENLP